MWCDMEFAHPCVRFPEAKEPCGSPCTRTAGSWGARHLIGVPASPCGFRGLWIRFATPGFGRAELFVFLGGEHPPLFGRLEGRSWDDFGLSEPPNRLQGRVFVMGPYGRIAP